MGYGVHHKQERTNHMGYTVFRQLYPGCCRAVPVVEQEETFLEDDFTTIVANPRQIKQLKGRKTDVNDSEHIAKLLRVGSIEPSFVPPRDIREARDITRQYQNLTEDLVRCKNRITKTLRQAGITMDTCMTDIFGKSGRAIIEAMIDGENVEDAAMLAKGKLRPKIPEIVEAVQYPLSEHYRVVLARYWRLLLSVEEELESLDIEIEEKMKPYRSVIDHLSIMPGIGRKVARGIVSEIGVDMTVFPTAKNLCSWAKVCPGNNSSGGKRTSGRNSKGNRYLRAYLGEAAWSAVRARKSAFRHQYLRRTSRLGKKKTIVSIMHKMLRTIHTMILRGLDYIDTYEQDRHNDPRFASVRSVVRKLTNEDLVRELLARGAQSVSWTWDGQDPAPV